MPRRYVPRHNLLFAAVSAELYMKGYTSFFHLRYI